PLICTAGSTEPRYRPPLFMFSCCSRRLPEWDAAAIHGKGITVYMSIKCIFLNISPRYVYAIDTFWRYVEKTRFFEHITVTCLWQRHMMTICR
ncbi:hypothetical protein FJ881_21375, partial [Escherichia albertii]|nr:hypothetical protein [Escherichia albertii]